VAYIVVRLFTLDCTRALSTRYPTADVIVFVSIYRQYECQHGLEVVWNGCA